MIQINFTTHLSSCVKPPTMINMVLHFPFSILPLLTAPFLGVFRASNILMQSWLRSVGTLRSMSRTRPMAFRKIVLRRRCCNESGVDETFFGSLPKIASSPSGFIIGVSFQKYTYMYTCSVIHYNDCSLFFLYFLCC